MPRPRLLMVEIVTPRKVQGLLDEEFLQLGQWVKGRLRLDELPRFVPVSVPYSVSAPEPVTTMHFVYSEEMADSGDYNDGFGDVEGEIITLVKRQLMLSTIYCVTKKHNFEAR